MMGVGYEVFHLGYRLDHALEYWQNEFLLFFIIRGCKYILSVPLNHLYLISIDLLFP